MKTRPKARLRTEGLSTPGYLGLLAGLAGALVLLNAGPRGAAGPAQEPEPPPTFTPSEQIDVEASIDFPYDI